MVYLMLQEGKLDHHFLPSRPSEPAIQFSFDDFPRVRYNLFLKINLID